MDLNDYLQSVFQGWNLPKISSYVAFWTCVPFVMLSTWLSWLTLRRKQNVQIVRVGESLPDKADLIPYLVNKSREVGNEQVANYLLAFGLAGKVNSQDELQKEGIKFLSEVTKTKDQKMADSLGEAFRILM